MDIRPTDKIIHSIIKKISDRKHVSVTPDSKPKRVSPTYDSKKYLGMTWNKERKEYDYNLD